MLFEKNEKRLVISLVKNGFVVQSVSNNNCDVLETRVFRNIDELCDWLKSFKYEDIEK
jgi:hypothetical protein